MRRWGLNLKFTFNFNIQSKFKPHFGSQFLTGGPGHRKGRALLLRKWAERAGGPAGRWLAVAASVVTSRSTQLSNKHFTTQPFTFSIYVVEHVAYWNTNRFSAWQPYTIYEEESSMLYSPCIEYLRYSICVLKYFLLIAKPLILYICSWFGRNETSLPRWHLRP